MAVNQAGPWRSRIVGTGEEDPEQLLANPRNWRTHSARQRDAIRGSLSTVGWVQSVIVNTTTGHVVDGHARIEEAISAGARVPVVYVELTEEEEGLVLATLDPIAAIAESDPERLGALLAEISTDDDALARLLEDLRPDEIVPPSEFADPEDGLNPSYRCPKCSHEWSGNPRP